MFWINLPIVITSVLLIIIEFDSFFQDENRIVRKSYIAAVVEYQRIGNIISESPEAILILNLAKYLEFISEAKSNNADIVVFPEYGLTTLQMPSGRIAARPFLITVPEIGVNPCFLNNSLDILRKLSCSAKQNQIYVVVNLGEIQPCSRNSTQSSCPEDGAFQYNTNVIFNREGDIIAKYHKYNLYFEDQFDAPPIPEYVTFETDFGVTFGTFICFDIIFYHPTIELVQNGIQNFVFTTAWVDELPLLTATQSNALWAMGTNTNLLVSGYHDPQGGHLGSGIFSGDAGPLNYTYDFNPGSRMIISEVPILPRKNIMHKNVNTSSEYVEKQETFFPSTNHFFLKENLEKYSTVSLDLTKDSFNIITTSHGNFSCSLKYKFQDWQAASGVGGYRLIAFKGFRKTTMEISEFGWEVCGVIRCLNVTLLESCTEESQVDSEPLPNFNLMTLSTTGMNLDGPMKPSLSTLDIYFQFIPYNHFIFSRKRGLVTTSSSTLAHTSVQTIAIINRIY